MFEDAHNWAKGILSELLGQMRKLLEDVDRCARAGHLCGGWITVCAHTDHLLDKKHAQVHVHLQKASSRIMANKANFEKTREWLLNSDMLAEEFR